MYQCGWALGPYFRVFVIVLLILKLEKEKTMPKMKTNRGAAKRFKVTAKGKVVYSKSHSNHILTKKTTKRKRSLRKAGIINKSNTAMIKRLIPYS
jgi:large subunit ribosomal protein L35